MKTQEELNVIKEEVETLNKKLQELTDEELVLVTGGEQEQLNEKNGGKQDCPYYSQYKSSITQYYSVCPKGNKSMACNVNCLLYVH